MKDIVSTLNQKSDRASSRFQMVSSGSSRDFKIDGITVKLWNINQDKEVTFLNNGFIGSKVVEYAELRQKKYVNLEMKLVGDKDFSFLPIYVTETPPHEVTELDSRDVEGCRTVLHEATIRKNKDWKWFVDRNSNRVRIVSMCPNGTVTQSVVALVSQEGDFFLTYQQVCEEVAYRDGDRVSIPGMARVTKWQSVGEFMEEYLSTPEFMESIAFDPIDKYVAPPEQAYEIGEVMFYSLPRQQGAIWTEAGPARVRWCDINVRRERDSLRYLLQGEKTTAEVQPIEEEENAKRRSGFSWECVNVRLKQ